MRSKTISLILEEGTPFGLRTLQMKNWSGKLFVCGRSAMKKLKDQEEAGQSAAYILIGDGAVYVGETDTLGQRLSEHVRGKDFWHELIAFTSPELQKTEVKYLEHVFIQRLLDSKRVKLLNTVTTKAPTIRKEVKDSIDEYLDRASDILLSLGYDFLSPSQEVESEVEKGVAVFCQGPDADATGYWNGDSLLVKKGSRIRATETATLPSGVRTKRAELLGSGLLKALPDSNMLELVADYIASSPSHAAEIVLSRSANGLTEWKTKEGKTLKQLE